MDSPELRKAYEKAEEAIREIINLETGSDAEHRILSEWVVVASEQLYVDGEPGSRVFWAFPPDMNIPHYRLLGLLEFAATRIRKEITEDGDS